MDYQSVEVALRSMLSELTEKDEKYPDWLKCEACVRSPCEDPEVCLMANLAFIESFLTEVKRRLEPVRLPDARDTEHDNQYGVNQQLG